jgi:hypothetical protein
MNLMHNAIKNMMKKFLSIRVNTINNEYKTKVFEKRVVLIFSDLSEVKIIAKNKIKNARKCL